MRFILTPFISEKSRTFFRQRFGDFEVEKTYRLRGCLFSRKDTSRLLLPRLSSAWYSCLPGFRSKNRLNHWANSRLSWYLALERRSISMCFLMPHFLKAACRRRRLSRNSHSLRAFQLTLPILILPGEMQSNSWQQTAPVPRCSILDTSRPSMLFTQPRISPLGTKKAPSMMPMLCSIICNQFSMSPGHHLPQRALLQLPQLLLVQLQRVDRWEKSSHLQLDHPQQPFVLLLRQRGLGPPQPANGQLHYFIAQLLVLPGAFLALQTSQEVQVAHQQVRLQRGCLELRPQHFSPEVRVFQFPLGEGCELEGQVSGYRLAACENVQGRVVQGLGVGQFLGPDLHVNVPLKGLQPDMLLLDRQVDLPSPWHRPLLLLQLGQDMSQLRIDCHDEWLKDPHPVQQQGLAFGMLPLQILDVVAPQGHALRSSVDGLLVVVDDVVGAADLLLQSCQQSQPATLVLLVCGHLNEQFLSTLQQIGGSDTVVSHFLLDDGPASVRVKEGLLPMGLPNSLQLVPAQPLKPAQKPGLPGLEVVDGPGQCDLEQLECPAWNRILLERVIKQLASPDIMAAQGDGPVDGLTVVLGGLVILAPGKVAEPELQAVGVGPQGLLPEAAVQLATPLLAEGSQPEGSLEALGVVLAGLRAQLLQVSDLVGIGDWHLMIITRDT